MTASLRTFQICLVDSVPPSTSPDSGPVTISYTEVQMNFLSMTYDTIGQRQTPESGFFRAPPLWAWQGGRLEWPSLTPVNHIVIMRQCQCCLSYPQEGVWKPNDKNPFPSPPPSPRKWMHVEGEQWQIFRALLTNYESRLPDWELRTQARTPQPCRGLHTGCSRLSRDLGNS